MQADTIARKYGFMYNYCYQCLQDFFLWEKTPDMELLDTREKLARKATEYVLLYAYVKKRNLTNSRVVSDIITEGMLQFKRNIRGPVPS